MSLIITGARVLIDGIDYVPRCENNTKYDSLADFMKASRRKFDWTLDEASVVLGISKTYLHNIESGRAPSLSFRIAASVATVYGVSLNELAVITGNYEGAENV